MTVADELIVHALEIEHLWPCSKSKPVFRLLLEPFMFAHSESVGKYVSSFRGILRAAFDTSEIPILHGLGTVTT